MIIELLTLFPGYFASPLEETILKRAVEAGVVAFRVRDIRRYASGRHRVTDDSPYGGGAGMVMKPEPVVGAIEAARADAPEGAGTHVALMTPSGQPLDQRRVQALARPKSHLVLVCGRYEGIDDRVRAFVDEEISVGDYVLSGGEPAALSVADAVVRLLPGALGDPASPVEESFSLGLLEYPQYTRPAEFRGMSVPDVLRDGHHAAIRRWRRKEALRRTRARRPDLWAAAELDESDRALLAELEAGDD